MLDSRRTLIAVTLGLLVGCSGGDAAVAIRDSEALVTLDKVGPDVQPSEQRLDEACEAALSLLRLGFKEVESVTIQKVTFSMYLPASQFEPDRWKIEMRINYPNPDGRPGRLSTMVYTNPGDAAEVGSLEFNDDMVFFGPTKQRRQIELDGLKALKTIICGE